MKDLWKPFFKKWFVALVGCSMGICVNHACLILVGDQGTYKTSWLNKLIPPDLYEYGFSGHINPSLTDGQTQNFLAEKLLINIDDQLEQIIGKDFNALKGLITTPSVSNRKAFHRFSPKRTRVCSFCGSVNEPTFLVEGQNRRYLTFTVDKINIDYEKDLDISKAYAQAYSIIMNDKSFQYWFSNEEINILNSINDSVYRKASEEEEILKLLFRPAQKDDKRATFLMSTEILKILNEFSGLSLSRQKLSVAMAALGYGDPIAKRRPGDNYPLKVFPVLDIRELEKEANKEPKK